MPFSSVWTRVTICWIPGAAPSIAGNASTSESGPLRQSFGAAAPAMPGVARSFAAIGSGFAPCSTRTTNGFITPGEMPACASAARPAIASPDPGRSFACASLGFIWKPE